MTHGQVSSGPENRRESKGSSAQSGRQRHRLRLSLVVLVGGNREVGFRPGLNFIRGDITTGKTSLVRLLRALLGTVPDDLPPEVRELEAVTGEVLLGTVHWRVYRPITTTASTPVELISLNSDASKGSRIAAVRLPATGAEGSYSRFLLDQLGIPAVSVPRARTEPTSALTTVSATDWLGYCIVPGDELDYSVFGHRNPFRDQKRRWVFELAYGLYDWEIARLAADLRSVELRIEALNSEADILRSFLAQTPFADRQRLLEELDQARANLQELLAEETATAADVSAAGDVAEVRTDLLEQRKRRDELGAELRRVRGQLRDLLDLRGQLQSQSSRLTRAIVADEQLVDFDFVVCPRCGEDLSPDRAGPDLCYLCLQHPVPKPSRQVLLVEQNRVVSQIEETNRVIADRERSERELQEASILLDRTLSSLATRLNELTATFVSDRATDLRRQATARASLESEIARLEDYGSLFDRYELRVEELDKLNVRLDELTSAIESREMGKSTHGDDNIAALEQRMLDYLDQLHIPQFGGELSVLINRKTFLPEVSGRDFDELSSQGLKTLVNVAHALAHHTVAVDRGLPLPGFLVLDGLSANAGREGFDRERVDDVYRLLVSVGQEYAEALQIIAVDNDVPAWVAEEHGANIALTLSQSDRLIRRTKQT